MQEPVPSKSKLNSKRILKEIKQMMIPSCKTRREILSISKSLRRALLKVPQIIIIDPSLSIGSSLRRYQAHRARLKLPQVIY